MLRPCSSPTGLVGPIGSNPESSKQVHGEGYEGSGKVIDQHPEEDASLQFTRLRIWGLYQNKLCTRTSYDKEVKHRGDKSRTKLELERRQSWRSGGWLDVRISRGD